jgi:hypothetical protein
VTLGRQHLHHPALAVKALANTLLRLLDARGGSAP